MGAGAVATKKVVIEVEVPEGFSEAEVKAYLAKFLRKIRALSEMEGSREPENREGAERLLREIKKRVAERSR